MIKVSIIIPMYNVEKYIGRCLDSLVNQTYKNIEILVIDDASKDNGKDVVKEYIKKHENVILIESESNKGVSNARNIGIMKSTGDYIMFSDSDDWYEQNAVETFVNVVNTTGADFVTANYFISYDDNKVKVDTTRYFSQEHITKEEIISYMTLTSCSKVIKKELFTNNNVFYPTDIKRCEEMTVIPVVAYLAKKPVAIKDVLYNYYQRAGSASNKVEKDISFYETTFNRFEKYLDSEKYKEEVEFRAIEHLAYGKVLTMLKSDFDNKKIKQYIADFSRKYKKFKKNKYLATFSVPKRVFIKLLNSKVLILHRIFAYLHKKVTA